MQYKGLLVATSCVGIFLRILDYRNPWWPKTCRFVLIMERLQVASCQLQAPFCKWHVNSCMSKPTCCFVCNRARLPVASSGAVCNFGIGIEFRQGCGQIIATFPFCLRARRLQQTFCCNATCFLLQVQCCRNVAGMLQECCRNVAKLSPPRKMLQECCRNVAVFFCNISATSWLRQKCCKEVSPILRHAWHPCLRLQFFAVAQLCPANTNQRGTLQTQPSQSRHII